MYKRYLNNSDYLSIVTEEALEQLTRGSEDRLIQAEEAAEESILEYLTENYEVEKVLAYGKNILPYNRQITYPAGAHFLYDGKIHKATRVINGFKSPELSPYWMEYSDVFPDGAELKPYTQRGTYSPGDIVVFANRLFVCLDYNGYDYDNVKVPGVQGWQQIKHPNEWVVNMEYDLWNVVAYENAFYALISLDDVDWNINPYESDNWGLIGKYDASINTYEFNAHELVEYEGEIFYPILKPNADELKEDFNIKPDDPRHGNIKKHMLRLAIYELYKLISPNNVSSIRITDYETSIAWLRDAARLRLNPQIPRKLGEDKLPVTEFAIATYQRDYDPYKNPWQI